MVRPQDIARLYEMINQGLVEIGNLPGLEEDYALEAELQADVVAN